MVERAIRQILGRMEDKLQGADARAEDIQRVLCGTPVSRLPLLFRNMRGVRAPGDTYNLKEQFEDPEKMLYGHLEEIAGIAEDSYGVPLTLRPNFGTILMPAAFGLAYRLFDDAYPWLTEHAGIQALDRLEDVDVANAPMVTRAVAYIKYFRERVPKTLHVYMPDTQGIFDLAHMLAGDELFYLLYDDPDAVHRLMRLCERAYCAVTDRLKAALGEEPHACWHGHALACGIRMSNGGVRISEDSASLLSPGHIDAFVAPYVESVLSRYGGGFIHYCGYNEHLLDKMVSLEGVRAINLGNPEMYSFDHVMSLCRSKDCVYFGHWHPRPEEDARAYLRRMWEVSSNGTQGLLLHCNTDLFSGVSAAQLQEIWNQGLEAASSS